jgi:hypothetical protein
MEVFYTDTARRQLNKLERSLQERIVGKMRFYASQSAPLEFAEPLSERETYRFRIGDYRVHEWKLEIIRWRSCRFGVETKRIGDHGSHCGRHPARSLMEESVAKLGQWVVDRPKWEIIEFARAVS